MELEIPGTRRRGRPKKTWHQQIKWREMFWRFSARFFFFECKFAGLRETRQHAGFPDTSAGRLTDMAFRKVRLFLSADNCHTHEGHNIAYATHHCFCYGCRCVRKVATILCQTTIYVHRCFCNGNSETYNQFLIGIRWANIRWNNFRLANVRWAKVTLAVRNASAGI